MHNSKLPARSVCASSSVDRTCKNQKTRYMSSPGGAKRTAELEKSLAAPPAPRAEDSNRAGGDLPETYGRNRLVMLVVDPHLVHTYWEVTPQRLAEARETLGSTGSSRAVLRFYHAAAGGAQASPADPFDVAVDVQSRNWYVHLWSPDKSYYAELGLKSDVGNFVPLVRSNMIRTPRAWPVMQVAEHFMRVDSVEPRVEPVPPPAFLRPHRERPVASVNLPAAEAPLESTPVPAVLSSAPLNSEQIMKEKLAGRFFVQPALRVQPQVRQWSLVESPSAESPSVQGWDVNLTGLAEQRFVAGIFSHAPRKTTDKA